MINFNNPYATTSYADLQSLGYSKEKLAHAIASGVDASKGADVILGALWTSIHPNSYQNQKFQRLVETAWSFLSALISDPKNANGNHAKLIEDGVKYVCYLAGANYINENPMIKNSLPQNILNTVHQYLLKLPELQAIVSQYQAKVMQNAGSIGGMNYTLPTADFTMPTVESTSPYATSTLPTMDVSGFGGAQTVKSGGLPTYDVGTNTTTVPQPAQAPVAAKVEGDPITNIVTMTGDEVDYENHRLAYLGENVLGMETPGRKSDFFGLLTSKMEVAHFVADNKTAGINTEIDTIDKLDVLVYRKDEPIYAFGAEHAHGILKCSLSHIEGIHAERVSTLFFYNEIEIISTYPTTEMLQLAIDASQFRPIVQPLEHTPVDLKNLAEKLRRYYTTKADKTLGSKVVERLNIEATRLFNEAVYIEFGIKAHGLNSVDSFTGDVNDAVEALIKSRSGDDSGITTEGLPKLVTDAIVRKVMCLHAKLTQPVLDLLCTISQVDEEHLEEYVGRYLYLDKSIAVLTLPVTTYELGLKLIRGPNDVKEDITPSLYYYLKKAIASLGDVKYELNSLLLITGEGAKYRVIYNTKGTDFALVPLF